NDVSIYLPNGEYFTKLVFNANAQGPQVGVGTPTLTVLTNEGTTVFNGGSTPPLTLRAHGSNFYTLGLTATGTTVIEKVTIDVTSPGLQDLEQVRIGGQEAGTLAVATPEPSTFTAAATGVVIFAGIAWRKRRRARIAAA